MNLAAAISLCGPTFGDPSYEEHLASEDKLVSDGQYDQALKLLSHIQDVHLKDRKRVRYDFDLKRCIIYRQAGQISEAEAACSRAIQIVEDEENKEIDDRDFSRGWRQHYESEAWKAYYLRSSIREEMGRFDEAEADELRMVQLFDDDPKVLNAVGYIWAERGVNLPCAADLLKDAIEAEPENPAILDSLGWAYYRSGDVEKAARFIDQSIARFGSEPSPDLAETLINRGDIYWHLGEQDQARAAWHKASDTLENCDCEPPKHLLSELEFRISKDNPEIDQPVGEGDTHDLTVAGIFTSSYDKIISMGDGMVMPSTGFRNFVFFGNGEAYKGLGSPLSLLKAPCIKKLQPHRWGNWSKEDNSHVFTWASGKKEVMRWQQLPAPEDYSAIIGKTYRAESVTTAGGFSGGDISVASSREITFLDDKTYTFGKFVGVTGNSVTAYRKENPSEFGAYELDQFSIRLAPDNGEPDEMLFYFGREAGDRIDYGLMVIGGTSYLLQD